MATCGFMCCSAFRQFYNIHSRKALTFYRTLNSCYTPKLALSTIAPNGNPNTAKGEYSAFKDTDNPTSDTSPKREPSDEEKTLMEENKKFKDKINELDDKYKRALAENENIRVRMRRQIEEAKDFGIQSFCKDLLEVADVLNSATESVPPTALTDNVHLKNLFEGLQMTEAQLQSVFRRHGLTVINPIGEKFDPHRHEALFEKEDSSKEPGTVAIVTKLGYKLKERTIRPALVGICKAPN